MIKVELSGDEHSQLNATLMERLATELKNRSLTVNEDCSLKMLVVRHENSGFQMVAVEPSPVFYADMFLLDTKQNTLLRHEKGVSGSAHSDLQAVINLAGRLANLIWGGGSRNP
ncbi:MAG: hypothetical protein AB1646_19605 [Thermodesulfobacteriota bacterium]